MKGCPKCGRLLPDEDFYRASSRRDGLDCYCKDCRKESNMRYSEAGQERRSRRLAADPEYRTKVADYNRNYQRSHYMKKKNIEDGDRVALRNDCVEFMREVDACVKEVVKAAAADKLGEKEVLKMCELMGGSVGLLMRVVDCLGGEG